MVIKEQKMEKVIDVTTARRQFGTLLDEVFYNINTKKALEFQCKINKTQSLFLILCIVTKNEKNKQ